MVDFLLNQAKAPLSKSKAILDIFDPKDDGGSVPYNSRDREVRLKNPPRVQFDLGQAKPPGTPGKNPTFDLSKAKPPQATAAPAPSGGKGWLASISEPSIKAAANLETGIIAPLLSDKSKKILQDKGLYTPGESPVKEYSTAAYGTLMAPVAPLIDAVTGGAKKTAQSIGVSDKTINRAGDLAGTAMDVLGVAGIPGAKGLKPKVGDAGLDSHTIESKLVDLEKKHDAEKDPARQEAIKKQMMNLVNTHPAVKGKASTEANSPNTENPSAHDIEMKLASLEKEHDAATDAAKQAQIKQKMMDLVNNHPSIKKPTPQFDLSKAKPPSAASEAVTGLRNIVSPESAGPKARDTATNIRAETGTSNRNISKAEAKLEDSYKTANSMTPEQHTDYYNYVENRSKGAVLSDPKLQKFADDTADVMKSIRSDIESLPEGEKIGFYEDYFPHQFKDPQAAKRFTSQFVARQGSSGNLKARKYPTLAEAQAAGLQLVDPNPVRAASRYVTSMSNYIGSKRIANQLVEKGDGKYYRPGKQPEGWVPLTGRFGERTRGYTKTELPDAQMGEEVSDITAVPLHEKLYAPPEVARIYNNFYSKGVEGGDLGKVYEVARTANAANTAAELSLSAYHLGTVTGQLLANDVSRILKNTLVGDWKGVGKAALSATVGQIPFVKGSTYKVGKKLIKQYKGLEDHGLDMESIAEHFERGGGKLGQDRLYRGGEEGGLLAAKGGLPEAVRSIKEKFNEPGLGSKGKAALEVFQRATEDVSYPLFEKYIPSIKTGAFANLMSDFLRQNPSATDAEIAAARKHNIDLVDERFGEMNMDNIFWHKLLKQTASLALRAPGWDIGLVRQAGGGVLDATTVIQKLVTGKKFDKKLLDRPSFLFSVMGTMALTSAAYQYMKTGKAPDEMLDYFAPHTGGHNVRGQEERTVLPLAAHGRELLHIAAPYASEGALGTESPLSGITQEASNKIASFPKNVVQAYNNEDYFGNPIGDVTGPGGWASSVPARVGHVAEGFLPFGLTEQGAKTKGSNLNTVERRLLGMRPASMEIASPDRYKEMRWSQEMKKELKGRKSAIRHEMEKE